jgi:hypothetical protein
MAPEKRKVLGDLTNVPAKRQTRLSFHKGVLSVAGEASQSEGPPQKKHSVFHNDFFSRASQPAASSASRHDQSLRPGLVREVSPGPGPDLSYFGFPASGTADEGSPEDGDEIDDLVPTQVIEEGLSLSIAPLLEPVVDKNGWYRVGSQPIAAHDLDVRSAPFAYVEPMLTRRLGNTFVVTDAKLPGASVSIVQPVRDNLVRELKETMV